MIIMITTTEKEGQKKGSRWHPSHQMAYLPWLPLSVTSDLACIVLFQIPHGAAVFGRFAGDGPWPPQCATQPNPTHCTQAAPTLAALALSSQISPCSFALRPFSIPPSKALHLASFFLLPPSLCI